MYADNYCDDPDPTYGEVLNQWSRTGEGNNDELGFIYPEWVCADNQLLWPSYALPNEPIEGMFEYLKITVKVNDDETHDLIQFDDSDWTFSGYSENGHRWISYQHRHESDDCPTAGFIITDDDYNTVVVGFYYYLFEDGKWVLTHFFKKTFWHYYRTFETTTDEVYAIIPVDEFGDYIPNETGHPDPVDIEVVGWDHIPTTTPPPESESYDWDQITFDELTAVTNLSYTQIRTKYRITWGHEWYGTASALKFRVKKYSGHPELGYVTVATVSLPHYTTLYTGTYKIVPVMHGVEGTSSSPLVVTNGIGKSTNNDESDQLYSPSSYTINAYPNPFNPNVRIALDLPRLSTVSLSIYDASAKQVGTIYTGELQTGSHEFEWIATDNEGKMLPAGIYLLRLDCNGYSETMKLMYLR